VTQDDLELAAHLRIEERELEAAAGTSVSCSYPPDNDSSQLLHRDTGDGAFN
jgi:hypothetical protein